MSIFTIQLRGRTVISGLGHKLLGRLLHSEKGSRRLKLAVWAMAANVMAKAFAFIVLLYSTHVAVEHLGPERFGVWMTISSIATLLSFVDLGISNAILNRATLLAGGTQPEANRVLTVGFVVLLAVGLVAAGALVSVFAFLPLDGWFKGISPTLEAEARQTG